LYKQKKTVRLFNIKTGELWKIEAEMEDLTKIVVALLRGKVNKTGKKTEADILGECERYIQSLSLN